MGFEFFEFLTGVTLGHFKVTWGRFKVIGVISRSFWGHRGYLRSFLGVEFFESLTEVTLGHVEVSSRSF